MRVGEVMHIRSSLRDCSWTTERVVRHFVDAFHQRLYPMSTADSSSSPEATPRSTPGKRKPRQQQVKDASLPLSTAEVLDEAPLDSDEALDNADRQFVVAVARALRILDAFQSSDGPLGNSELALRTGLPKPTVSRLTYTLAQCGYLDFHARYRVYGLGGRALGLGCIALANMNVQEYARAQMQELADESGFTVSLGTRDRHAMIYTEVCESKALVAIRAKPGFRVPLLRSAMGRAYLCGLAPEERDLVLEQLAQEDARHDRAMREEDIARAIRECSELGYCTSIGDMQADVNGVAVPLTTPQSHRVYAISLGGPSYMLTKPDIHEKWGERLVQMASHIQAHLSRATQTGEGEENRAAP